MSDKSEKLAFRLSDILTRIFMGEVLSIEQLMKDYQVSEKTLRRDFNERLIKAPIVKGDDGYKLAPTTRLTSPTIQRVLSDSGLASFLPSCINVNQLHRSILFKHPRIENTESFSSTFNSLSQAISTQSIVTMVYNQETIEVHPYLLVNDRGLWYLAATFSGVLNSYRISKISHVLIELEKFSPDSKVRADIYRQGMEWLSTENADILLQVDPDLASMFKGSAILPNQQILKELIDGSLLVSCRVTKLGDVLPTLKAWMPKIEVLSPVSLKLELIRELNASLERL